MPVLDVYRNYVQIVPTSGLHRNWSDKQSDTTDTQFTLVKYCIFEIVYNEIFIYKKNIAEFNALIYR